MKTLAQLVLLFTEKRNWFWSELENVDQQDDMLIYLVPKGVGGGRLLRRYWRLPEENFLQFFSHNLVSLSLFISEQKHCIPMSEVALVWGALSMCKPAKTHMPGEVNTFFWNIFKSNQMDILVLKIKFERSVPEFLFGRLWNILTGPVRAIQLGQNRMPLQHNSGRASIKYFRTFLRIML